MKGKRFNFIKVITVICAMLLLVSALYIPGIFNAVAESDTMKCDFETAISTDLVDQNKAEALANGLGYFGWGAAIKSYEGDKVLAYVHDKSEQNWATVGGYRLNNNCDMLNLKPATSYVVTFKLKVVSAPKSISGSNSAAAYVSIGYGSVFDPQLGGNSTNYVNTLTKKISDVFTAKKDAKSYTVYNNGSSYTKDFSREWFDVTYTFTTPSASELGNIDMALSFYTNMYYGVEAYIDDVQLVEVSVGDGVAIFNDEYGSVVDIVTGKVGEAVTLLEISSRKNQNDHIFEGWCSDKELTLPVTEAVFGAEPVVLYSKWDAPVTYTFLNTLTNEENKINGNAGEAFDMPADLVDANGETWFMGWYNTSDYTDEFKDTNFGYKSKTIYSKWMKEIPVLSQDFENYTKEQHQVVVENGYNVKNNRLYFSMMMQKQSEETYGGSGNAIKFAWDKNMNKTPDNPSSYVAASRYSQMDMYVWVGKGLSNGENYIATIKYKVESADTDFTFYMASANDNNIWANYTVYPGSTAISKSDAGQGWKEAKIAFTTNYKNASATTMFFGIKLVKNENVTIYFDDIDIQAKAQPYESYINIEPNNGTAAYALSGTRGKEVVLPEITHPDGAEFLGWYTDKDLKNEFVSATFERNPFTVYAKWGPVPVTFKNYADNFFSTPDNQGFGKICSIDDSGLGIDDDYVLRVNYHAGDIYKVVDGKNIYMNTRYNQLDQLAQVAKNLTNGTDYRLSFWVKVLDSNVDMRIRLFSGHSSNIWVVGDRTEYTSSVASLSKNANEWQQISLYFTSDLKGNGSTLYLVVNYNSTNLTDYSDIIIDNVMLEEVSPPYLMFDPQNGEQVIFQKGKEGETIVIPENPYKFGNSFTGWYLDKACTQKFTETIYSKETGYTVYAGYSINNSATYTFEKYDLKPNALAPGKYHVEDAVLKKVGNNTVVEFDRTGYYNPGRSGLAIAHGSNIAQAKIDQQCVVTFKYRLTKAPESNIHVSVFSANADNMWAYTKVLSPQISILRNESVGVWKTEVLVLDTSLINVRENVVDNSLYFSIQAGKGGIIQIDDVKVTIIPKGQSIVAVRNGGCDSIPSLLTGKQGQSFKNKLPEAPVLKGQKFVGYFKMDAAGKYVALNEDDYKFGKDAITVFARFFPEKIEQNFDGEDFKTAADYFNGFTVFDFDYEHYDSEAEGNSKDNVASGRYSLHRKGDSRHVEASILLPLGKNISESSRYTITMKVKLGKHFHTDGAIKIASGRSFYYPWTTTGDFYSVVPIADLKEGEWVEVSYTFNSVEGFVTITTPGYVELFIDDVVFTLVDKTVPVSTPKQYTEYVTAPRDANGNLLGIQVNAIDVDAIIDESLNIEQDSSNNTMLIVIIAGGAAVVVAAAIILLLVIKKKKKKA